MAGDAPDLDRRPADLVEDRGNDGLKAALHARATRIAETVARDGAGANHEIFINSAQRTSAGHRVLERLYERWLRGLNPR